MNILEYAVIRKMVGGGSGEPFVVLDGESPTADDLATAKYRLNCPAATSIDANAFENCDNLTAIDLPVATSIGDGAFGNCSSLTAIDLPVATSIVERAFSNCTSLTAVNLPVATSIGGSAFGNCSSLTAIDLPVATSIGVDAFYSCTNLITIILRKSDAICNMNLTAILDTKIATVEGVPTGEGFIYVPTALFEDYVANFVVQITTGFGFDEATADYIARAVLRKIEDYPEICGS